VRARFLGVNFADGIDEEPEFWSSAVPDEFEIGLDFQIGDADGPASDAFFVTVTTPKSLCRSRVPRTLVFPGYHQLIVFEYNFDRILRAIGNYVTSCTGETWEEVVWKVSLLGQYADEGTGYFTREGYLASLAWASLKDVKVAEREILDRDVANGQDLFALTLDLQVEGTPEPTGAWRRSLVCSPAWLQHRHRTDQVIPGWHRVFALQYEEERILEELWRLARTEPGFLGRASRSLDDPLIEDLAA
jgi:hypothetical protein